MDGTLTQNSTYEDVANAFGAEGIQMVDKDYTPSTKIHVLVTFKVKDGNLTYYAYSSEGITFMDVK